VQNKEKYALFSSMSYAKKAFTGSGVGGGYKHTPKSFDFSKIWAKFLKILTKSM